MNLLEIGKIVRTHGIKGAVKVISYVDENFSHFKSVYLTEKHIPANITQSKMLNKDAYAINLDCVLSIEEAEKLKNKTIFINREEYSQFKDKIYLSDLINKPVITPEGEDLGIMIDYDDFGASVILTIKSGSISVMLPYVDEIVMYNADRDAFVIDKQKFEDFKVWK